MPLNTDHPLVIPNLDNANASLPLLDAKGKCNYCGLWPMVILDDEDQVEDFPTGHTSRCLGLLRGITPKMDTAAVRKHLEKRFGIDPVPATPAYASTD